jgi:uncharacterized protein (TIGR02453 family)
MIQKQTLTFFKNLKKNNNRQWFLENKPKYTDAKDDISDFAEKLIAALVKHNKRLGGLTAKDCIFRIFRDVRFSKDKTPYKTHSGVVVAEGGRKSELAGFYIQFAPGKCFIAGGCWSPDGPAIRKIRQEIDYNYNDFKKIVKSKKFKANFGELIDNRLKTTPKGYSVDNPAIDDLRQKRFIVSKNIGDKIVTGDQLITECVESYKAMLPLIQFLNTGLE